MPGRARKGMNGLQGALDNDVYNAISNQLHDAKTTPSISSLYQFIQKSNSSLKRKPKRVLEDSLERILDTVKMESPDEPEETLREIETVQDANIMNRAITSSWQASIPVTALDAPAADPASISVGSTQRREADGQPLKKRSKQRPAEQQIQQLVEPPPKQTQLEDLGGLDDVKRKMMDLLVLPLLRPGMFSRLGVSIPTGILLYGPPGCGKTSLARACAATCGVSFVEIFSSSIVSSVSGESEKRLRDEFEMAHRKAPAIIFIDEIDVIAAKRENSQSGMEKRVVAQLMGCMDSLDMNHPDSNGKPVIVIAATNAPDALDSALRRAGRFDTEIRMGVPDEPMRHGILKAKTRKVPLAKDVDLAYLAKRTPGYVGADLNDLVQKAGHRYLDQYRDAMSKRDQDTEMALDAGPVEPDWSKIVAAYKNAETSEPPGFENWEINMEHFLAVLPTITPSTKREGFTATPDLSWQDIGALHGVREELKRSIVGHIEKPDLYASMGINTPTSFLLWGPPGCGKTLLARVIAAESNANFISIRGPELLSKFVGDSESNVRRVFHRARSAVPCIIFFDEFDALAPRRDDVSSEASSRVVATLLAEMGGLSDRKGIFIIAATNRPDAIDQALLRPGRLDRTILVGLPSAEERVDILRAVSRSITSNGKLPDGVEELVGSSRCDGFSGADLRTLVEQASLHAVRGQRSRVELEDFHHAVSVAEPSVRDIEEYEDLKAKFGSGI